MPQASLCRPVGAPNAHQCVLRTDVCLSSDLGGKRAPVGGARGVVNLSGHATFACLVSPACPIHRVMRFSLCPALVDLSGGSAHAGQDGNAACTAPCSHP